MDRARLPLPADLGEIQEVEPAVAAREQDAVAPVRRPARPPARGDVEPHAFEGPAAGEGEGARPFVSPAPSEHWPTR